MKPWGLSEVSQSDRELELESSLEMGNEVPDLCETDTGNVPFINGSLEGLPLG